MKEGSVINKPPPTDVAEEFPEVDSRVEPFSLQPDPDLDDRSSYQLSDLLRYHDHAFVLNAYSAIAKRPPEPARLDETLQELRSGRRTKTEIVEDLVAKYPNVRVDGLSSPAMRRLSRLPVIGPGLRTLRAIIRLPVLLQHQQQFEGYMAGQHQRISDYMNDVVVTNSVAGNEISMRHTELQENVSDAIKTVMMLSDSLIELSAQVANGEDRLQQLQVDREKADAELRKHMLELTEQLMTSAQQLQRQQEQQATSVQHLQKQQETSESRLHADLVALTDQVSALQQALTDAKRTQDQTAAAQREFLIDEQRAIVEAQRAALTDLQEQLNDLRGSLTGLQDDKITRSRKKASNPVIP